MTKLLFAAAVAAMASGISASPVELPSGYRAVVARGVQGSKSSITMGRATINWGTAKPNDITGMALKSQCGTGTQCDQNPWTQDVTVCSDNTAIQSCVTESLNIVCDGQWPDDEPLRTALLGALATAMAQGIQTATVTDPGTASTAYTAYVPPSEFDVYQQASFVGITVYNDDETEIAQVSATISLQEIDDDWCGSAASDLFGAGGAIASATGQEEGAAVLGALGAICASGT